MAHDVFISYSTKDKPAADAACARLEGRGIRCWIAPRDILPGADWGSSIIDAINAARAMVLVFSGNANHSKQIIREVERAANRGIPMIPLRIENVAPERGLEFFISSSHWLDAYTPPLDRHLTYLGDVIAHILEGKAVPARLAPVRPWWRGPAGLAAGGVVVAVAAVGGWFALLRPPPGFVGIWNATALDIHQFNGENGMIAALVPAVLLDDTLQAPDAKGVLTVDASGRFSLAVSGTDEGTVTSQPAMVSSNFGGNTLTFTSDVTHRSLSANVDFVHTGNDQSNYSPQTDPVPDGQETLEMVLMAAGQSTGGSIGVMTGNPDYQGAVDAAGDLLMLGLLAGTWRPAPMTVQSSMADPDNAVTATLNITADGRYRLAYSLRETGLWRAANGNWTRQGSVTVGYGMAAPDSGTYMFSGRDQVTLVDQNGSSTWKRGL
jgi:hypothetical protein